MMQPSTYVNKPVADSADEISSNLADSYEKQLDLENKIIKYGEWGAVALVIGGLAVWLRKKVQFN